MSIKDEIERIGNNVSDALAATAEMGATVPDGANSNNLGTLIRSIPQSSGGGLPPLRIYAVKNGVSYTQEIIEGGATQTYTAEQIHEIAKERVVTIEIYTSRDSSVGHGMHRYFTTTFSTNGTVNLVAFRGVYVNASYKLVPAYVTVNNVGNIFVSDEKWAGSSVETDTSLTKSSFPADAKIVGNRLTALSEQIANMGSGGGTSIDVTASVGQTIVVKEVDANGKPTAWEAVDHQPRTHWSETGTVTILPETTIEIDPDEGGMLPVDFVLEPNKPYTIKYNGVEYADCTGIDTGDGIVYFGNLGAVDESFPFTDHPFILASVGADLDEDGNTDYIIAVHPLDGSESVTVSIYVKSEITHKLPEKYIPSSVPHVEYHGDAILSNYVMTKTDGQCWIDEPMGNVTIGSNYEVTIGNRKFQCTVKEYSDESVYAVLSDESEYVEIGFVHPEIAAIIGHYGLIRHGSIDGETLSISASYTAHKIDERCLMPPFKVIEVDCAYDSDTQKYIFSTNTTYDELLEYIRSGWFPVIRLNNAEPYGRVGGSLCYLSDYNDTAASFVSIYGFTLRVLVWERNSSTQMRFVSVTVQ